MADSNIRLPRGSKTGKLTQRKLDVSVGGIRGEEKKTMPKKGL